MENGLANKVKAYRTLHGLSVRDFASLAGISHQTVYQVEAGRQDLSLNTIRAIAKAIGLTVQDCLK